MGPRALHFYALAEEGGWTLFDAGLPGSVERRRASGEIPGQVVRAIISHADADHVGDGGSLVGAEILCHALDRDWISNHDRLVAERYGPAYCADELVALRAACGPDFAVHRTVEDGERLRIGRRTWRVLHVPGHTHGHIALWGEDDGVLLTGDAVLGLAIPDREGRPSMPPTHCHIREYLATIERLEAVPVSTVLSGHWPPLDAAGFRKLLAESRRCVERDMELMAACSGQPLSADDYAGRICERFRSWPEAEDRHYVFAVAGYLEYLTAGGVLERLADGRHIAARGVGGG